MFKSGKTPVVSIARSALKPYVTKLFAAGYEEHDGRKTKMKDEILTFRKKFITDRGKERQNHVQLVFKRKTNKIAVYAHTEPYMGRTVGSLFSHGYAAFTDKVSYQAGARMLRADIKAVGQV